MTPSKGLKRLGLGLAIVAAGIAGTALVIPWLIRADAVREAVQAEIRNATGLEPALQGALSIATLPSTAASFSNITLSEEGDREPALAAERLTARLRLLPLLLGRIEVADITLTRPQVLVSIDANGRSNWGGLLATLSRAVGPAPGSAERPLSLSEIRLVGGTVVIRNQQRNASETLDAVDASLAWPSISKSFGATGHFVWRGEKIDASITLSDFMAALTGERSGLKVRMTGAPLKFAFDGHVGRKPTLKVEGTLAADGPSLRQALQWAGEKPLPGGGFGRFALKAQASVLGDTVALSGVNMELDGNGVEGVLTLTGDKRPVLQGTLAAEEINITPYLSEVRLLGANERQWNRLPITLEGFSSLDFDLRLSASRVTLGGSNIGRTAVGASLREGRLAVTIGESQAFGGVLKGSMGLAKADSGADLRAQLHFTDVDLEACMSALFGVRRLEGRGDVALLLEASGADVEGLARAVTGEGSINASRGALNGLNVEQVLRRLERRPLSGAGDFRNGRTPFESLAISVKVAGGTATVENMKLEGSAVRLALEGSASIPARNLDLQGKASLVVPAVKDAPAFELPFAVRGSWDDPQMLPDVQSLLRRSGAAQPLLDAVRTGRSREAVRSAIEQLTRGDPPQAATATETPASATTPQ